jgi:hypothetical protein
MAITVEVSRNDRVYEVVCDTGKFSSQPLYHVKGMQVMVSGVLTHKDEDGKPYTTETEEQGIEKAIQYYENYVKKIDGGNYFNKQK